MPFDPSQQSSWYNQQSPMANWQQQYAPNQAGWTNGAAGHFGQQFTYNPFTGQQGWKGSDLGIGSRNNMLKWTDPNTGNSMIDPKLLMSQFGFGGQGQGGGYQSFDPSAFEGGQMQAPGAYGGGDWDVPKNVVNVHDVIQSYRPQMEAEIGAGFAQAGNRLGQSGFAMSTPYAQKLGEVEDLARNKMNQRGLEYEYNAGQFDAGNQMQAMMGKNAEQLAAWQQSGNWDMASQAQNLQNQMQQWMAQNQWGFQDNQGQNQWNQQQQQSQQSFLANLLGGLL